jgi:hypothetical protein
MKKKPGRPVGTKYIETPERMWELFCAYKQDTKADPFREHDFVGKDGDSVHRERERCLTMEGFELYVAEQDLNTDLSHYFSNAGGAYEQYLAVCSRVRKSIRKDQIEGGMAGIYNPSITQRLNGLVEKSSVEVREQPLLPDGE